MILDKWMHRISGNGIISALFAFIGTIRSILMIIIKTKSGFSGNRWRGPVRSSDPMSAFYRVI